LIESVLGDVRDCTFFLCGPAAMYDFVLPELEKLKIPGRRIRKEVQSAPKRPWEMPGWPEELDEHHIFTVTVAHGKTIQAAAGDSLLTSLEKGGVTKKSQCRSGECAVCRSRVLKGEVFHPGTAKMRKSDMRFGYIHPCVTYPITDLTLLI
jgi:ferredoxin